jgi:hypothetical protein
MVMAVTDEPTRAQLYEIYYAIMTSSSGIEPGVPVNCAIACLGPGRTVEQEIEHARLHPSLFK